jgi:hypothetical protein
MNYLKSRTTGMSAFERDMGYQTALTLTATDIRARRSPEEAMRASRADIAALLDGFYAKKGKFGYVRKTLRKR